MARMKYSQFVVCNCLAGAVPVFSVAPAAYGVGKVSTSQHDPGSVGMLAGGAAVGAAAVILAVRYHRRRKARSPHTHRAPACWVGYTRVGFRR